MMMILSCVKKAPAPYAVCKESLEIINSWKPARIQSVTKEMRDEKKKREERQQDERQTVTKGRIEGAARTMAMSQTVYCICIPHSPGARSND